MLPWPALIIANVCGNGFPAAAERKLKPVCESSMIARGAVTSSVTGIVVVVVAVPSMTLPRYVPGASALASTVTVSVTGADGVAMPLLGDTLSHAPPEFVPAVVVNVTDPLPVFET